MADVNDAAFSEVVDALQMTYVIANGVVCRSCVGGGCTRWPSRERFRDGRDARFGVDRPRPGDDPYCMGRVLTGPPAPLARGDVPAGVEWNILRGICSPRTRDDPAGRSERGDRGRSQQRDRHPFMMTGVTSERVTPLTLRSPG
jgi:hypothetical protein